MLKLLNKEFDDIENLSIDELNTDSATIYTSPNREAVIADACNAVHTLVTRNLDQRNITKDSESTYVPKPLNKVWDFMKD